MSSKSTTNLIVDSLAFAGFAFLTSTGIVLHYLLPPGSGRSLELWGLSRHDWGDIHFATAVALFFVLSVHLILHFKWVTSVVAGRDKSSSGWRLLLGLVAALAIIALAAAPLVSPVTN
ncbi:MAG: DUF4405 domain-containing protein, partial [Bdellovibrionales bacterium]|nr:DUF4405 domain-containing protein [Bdellovibrionales bacterium]